MAKKRNDALIEALALHLATGGKHEPWAKEHGVGVRTAWEWAAPPGLQGAGAPPPQGDQRPHPRPPREARQAGTAKIAKLLATTENEALAFQIAKDVRDTYRTMLDRDELKRRLTALEEAQHGDDHAE